MNIIKKILIAVFLLVFVSATSGAVNAAFLKFDKASYSVNTGDSFDVEIIVDPGADQITSIDSYITYDSSIINADSVKKAEPEYFPTVLNDLTSGKAYVAGLVNGPSEFKTGVGTVAKINFVALKEGETDLVFDCDDQATVTSKVIKNDIDSTDIIECSQNGTATVTVGVGGEAIVTEDTPTPTPTQAVVTQLPASGSAENMMMLGMIGAVLVVIGGVGKLIRPY